MTPDPNVVPIALLSYFAIGMLLEARYGKPHNELRMRLVMALIWPWWLVRGLIKRFTKRR